MRILALHVRDTANAGDRASCPLDYFEFEGHEVVKADLRHPPDIRPDVVVYGGGSIIASADFHAWPGALTVAWGVGHHERERPWEQAVRSAHKKASALCDLYFPRDDAGPQFERVPCASCLHSVFDEDHLPPPSHEVVRYSAARRVEVSEPAGAPHMSNEDGRMEDSVRFLASGQTVVTSSYHGAYWARLLGRDVRVLSWGSKFDDLPQLSLAACRDANRAAYRSVKNLINAAKRG